MSTAYPVVMCKQCGVRGCHLERRGWATPVCFHCIRPNGQASNEMAAELESLQSRYGDLLEAWTDLNNELAILKKL